MKKVLVAGSTGYLGRYLVRALRAKGFWVRALARNPDALQRPGKHLAPPVWADVNEVFTGEITKPDTLKGVCAGIDCVVSAIGITRQKDGVSFRDVDYQGNVNLLREAEARGVDRFMYISVFRGNELPGMLNAAKEQFVARLRQSAIGQVIVRPTGYFSDLAEVLQMAVKGRVYLIGNGSKRMNPIHGADLADFCADHLTGEKGEFNIGGPEVFMHRDIARLAFQAAGKPEKITTIPAWLFRVGISPLKPISPNDFGAAQFLLNVMTHDMAAPCYGSRDLLTHFREVYLRKF